MAHADTSKTEKPEFKPDQKPEYPGESLYDTGVIVAYLKERIPLYRDLDTLRQNVSFMPLNLTDSTNLPLLGLGKRGWSSSVGGATAESRSHQRRHVEEHVSHDGEQRPRAS